MEIFGAQRLGRVPEAFLTGKTWNFQKALKNPVEAIRKRQLRSWRFCGMNKPASAPGGICHKIQIDLIYHSNHIGGKRLTHDQTRDIFETKAPGINDESVNVGDIIETTNHFRRIDMMIDRAPAR